MQNYQCISQKPNPIIDLLYILSGENHRLVRLLADN